MSVEKRKQEMMAAMDARNKQKQLTVEKYEVMKSNGVTDAKNVSLYGIDLNKLNKWKRDNNLIGKHNAKSTQQATQKPKGEKAMNDKEKMNVAPSIDFKAKYEEAEKQHAEQTTHLEKLIAELKAELEKPKDEDISLQYELERLKNYERDYRNLEVDYRNLHTENERLQTMLDRLKHTETMNVMLMEQRVYLQRQIDEVMA